MPAKITKKQERFVDAFMISFKPYDAAIEAGYSHNVAKSKAYQWVSKREHSPLVYDEIKKRTQERLKSYEATVENVLKELCRVAFCESPQQSEDMKLETKPTTTERLRALEMIGKHLGMWKENIALTGKDGEPIAIIQRTIVDPKKPAKD